MARKNLLSGLLDEPVLGPDEIGGKELTAVNLTRGRSSTAADPLSPISGRGAVGAMSRSLELLTAEAEAARSVEAQLLSAHKCR